MIVKDCGAEVSTPPIAVPPLSWATRVIVALPLAFAAGVKVRTPADETAGAVVKSAALVLPVTTKITTWPASSAGPGLMPVAQPTNVCAPLSSSTVTAGPATKDGAWFGPLRTLSDSGTAPVQALASVAVTVNVNGPAAVGVPDRTPVVAVEQQPGRQRARSSRST